MDELDRLRAENAALKASRGGARSGARSGFAGGFFGCFGVAAAVVLVLGGLATCGHQLADSRTHRIMVGEARPSDWAGHCLMAFVKLGEAAPRYAGAVSAGAPQVLDDSVWPRLRCAATSGAGDLTLEARATCADPLSRDCVEIGRLKVWSVTTRY